MDQKGVTYKKIVFRTTLILLSIILSSTLLFAQKGVINNGSKIIIESGAYLKITGENGDFTNKTNGSDHGKIDLDGQITLQGNWTNNVSSGNGFINNDGIGNVLFNGTAVQSVGGSATTYFEDIYVSGSSGLSLNVNTNIYDSLYLSSGSVALNNYNLFIDKTGGISGTYSASRMIITNGSGTLKLGMGSTGSYLFPIGDTSGTNEYTPVELTINSAGGFSAAYISANVQDSKHPENNSPSEYLSRYWSLTTSGITTPDIDVNMTYVDDDIVGDELNIYAAKYNGSTRTLLSKVDNANNLLSATGLATLSDFTGVDGTAPTVSISSTATSPTNTSPIPVNIDFSEEVSGFVLGDITVTNGDASNLQTTNNQNYTIDVTPDGDDTIYVDIVANVAQDIAGNGNTEATQFSIMYDGTSPIVTLSTSESNPTNTSPFIVTIEFDEDVTGFDLSDLSVGNGSADNLTLITADYKWTAEIAPSGTGEVTVDIAADAANDAAGNGNTIATTLSRYYDGTSPTVTLSTGVSSPTNTTPFEVTITFDEYVTNFGINDISVGNGNADNLLNTTPNKVWAVDIIPTADGEVTVDIAADAAIDTAANGNTAATQLSVTYDGTSPGATITTAESDPTNSSSFDITITFDESVSGFEVGDLTVGNGSAGSFSNSTPGIEWTATITPSGQGLVTVDIAADAVTDDAGNGNVAASQFSITYDITAPSVTSLNPYDGETSVAQFADMELNFDEIVRIGTGNIEIYEDLASDVLYESIDVTTAQVSGDSSTIITINPSIDFGNSDNYYVQIPSTAFTDRAGNNYTGISNTTDWNFTSVDANSPVISSLAPADNNIDVSITSDLTITFNENVNTNTGYIYIKYASDSTVFESFDVSTSSAISGDGTSTIVINPSDFAGETDYFVQIDGTAFQDVDTNPFAGIASATQWNFSTADVTPPAISTTSPADEATNVSVDANLIITFSEDVDKGSGDIVIKRVSDNSTYKTIPVSGTNVTISGAVVTINPDTDFESDSSYYVNMASGVFTDLDGNNFAGISNSTDWNFSMEDIVQPDVTVSYGTAGPINTSPFVVDIVFTEYVTGLAVGEISVTNGTAANLNTTDNIHYTVEITPASNGSVTVQVAAGVSQDASGNFNTTSNLFSINYDGTKPKATLSTTETSPSNSSTFEVSIVFDEAISGFVDSDISVLNGSVTNFVNQVANTEWIATITPSADDTVEVYLLGGVATDDATNGNEATDTVRVFHDSSSPAVSLTSGESTLTNLSPFQVTITFDEEVTGFTIGDIAVSNCIADNLVEQTVNKVWTVDITPSADGTVTVDVPAGKVFDDAGNGNTAATQFSIDYDGTIPEVVSITSTENDPTSNSPFDVDVEFSEDVSGLISGDFTLSNVTINNIASGDNITYSLTVTPSADGNVSIQLPADKVSDAAGNTNTASETFTIEYDSTNPTILGITTSETDPTSNSPFVVSIQFSEEVVGFVSDSITVTNANITGLNSSDNITYLVELTPVVSGTVTLEVEAGKTVDLAGNTNDASSVFSIQYDGSEPYIVSITTIETDPTPNAAFDVEILFSEEVTGFTTSDISITNGTVTAINTTDSITYTASIGATSDGSVSLFVKSGAVYDASDNTNGASTVFSISYDGTQPFVQSMTTSNSDPTNQSPIIYEMVMNEEVAGLESSDFTVVNGSITNFTTTDNIIWTIEITPAANGIVSITMPAGVASDAAGNANTASSTYSIVYDTTQPGVVISSSESDPTSNSPMSFTITFDELVRSFAPDSITISNGSVYSLSTTDSIAFALEVTPTANGTVSVSILADKVTDLAGNTNTASNVFEIVYDSSLPFVSSITSTENDPTSNSPFDVTITFSEKVYGFVSSGIDITNGTVTDMTTTDSVVFIAEITPENDGLVKMSVFAGAAIDASGNPNSLSDNYLITYDSTPPVVMSISTSESDPTYNSPFYVDVLFSEEVSGFDVGDISITNGSITGAATTDSTTFTVEVTPVDYGEVSLYVVAGAVVDHAQNSNAASSVFTITYSVATSTPPTVNLSTTQSTPSNSPTYDLSIVFSEVVSGFAVEDLSLTNCTAGEMTTADSTTFVTTITVTNEGSATVQVPKSVAVDNENTDNEASEVLTLVYDITSPDATITSSESEYTNLAEIPITVSFSEYALDIDLTDFTVENATLSMPLKYTGSSIELNLNPVSDGLVSVQLPAGAVTDSAGNTNNASNLFTIKYDSSVPTVSVSTADSTVNTTNFDVDIVFSERVGGFELTDISLSSNASYTSLSTSDSTSFVASIQASSEGDIKVYILEGVAVDSAGNANVASDTLVVTYSTSTGLDNPEEDNVKIYGYRNTIVVEFTADELPEFTKGYIEVYNSSGLPILKDELIRNKVNRFEVQQMTNIYFVKLIIDNKLYVKKLLLHQ